MGIIYTGNNEIVTLYQAYGLTVNGIIHDYVWTIYENKREKCYTYIEFLDAEGNIFYSRQMGNNVILEGCFQKHIDNVLWYLSHDTDFDRNNSYDFDKLITDVLIKNSALFSYRIEQRKQKEKRKEEEAQALKEKFNELGYEVNMLKITHLSHTRFVANKSAVTVDFLNWLQKKMPELNNMQFVYDPTETFSVGSDFTVILAEG